MSTYAEREKQRRYLVVSHGEIIGRTADFDQAEHLRRLAISDGHKDVQIKIRTANQEDYPL